MQKYFLHLHPQTDTNIIFHCPDGGIGRRARLKLVYLGVWVRFPLRVLNLSEMGGFFIFITTIKLLIHNVIKNYCFYGIVPELARASCSCPQTNSNQFLK